MVQLRWKAFRLVHSSFEEILFEREDDCTWNSSQQGRLKNLRWRQETSRRWIEAVDRNSEKVLMGQDWNLNVWGEEWVQEGSFQMRMIQAEAFEVSEMQVSPEDVFENTVVLKKRWHAY